MAELKVAFAKGVYRKMDIIKAMNLKKYYTSDTYEVRALDGVSLIVEEGEFIAVVGTSGCGKTTLMNILGGLDTTDFGGVWIRNTSLKDLSKEERTIFRRRNIGFVFQQYNLIPSLSIRENIVLSSLLRSFKLVFLIQTPPKSGVSRPPKMFISVVFPHPDVPTTAINSPSSTVNDTPSKARTSYVSDV